MAVNYKPEGRNIHKYLKVLAKIAKILTTQKKSETLYEKIIKLVKEAIQCERATVWLNNGISGILCVTLTTKKYPPYALKNLDTSKAIPCKLISTKKDYILVKRLNENPNYTLPDAKVKSVIGVPIKNESQRIGAITVESYKENSFNDDDLTFLSCIGNQITLKIEQQAKNELLEKSFVGCLKALSTTQRIKDIHTSRHSKRVKKYALMIAKNLKLTKYQFRRLKYASFLHDIGKIGIDNNILNKKGVLTKKEKQLVMRHPELGENIVNNLPCVPIYDIIRAEHERYDGKGYPFGLKGEKIPIEARIIAVADAFDAMTTNRPYRKAINKYAAIKEIKKGAGSQFDPEVVKAFVKAFRNN